MFHYGAEEELEGFVSSAQDSIEFKFVEKEEDIFNDELVFRPEFTHQVFENEKIFGYKNLKIKLYYTPDHLTSFIDIHYDDKVNPRLHQGARPDNIFKLLLNWIPEGFLTNQDHFISKLTRRHPFTPFGELLHVHGETSNHRYEIYKVDISSVGFKEYHERLQTFLIWFVDAASYIDTDDDKWTFYLIFKRSSAGQYAIAGYATVYAYYAYPDKIRPRISQMLILPPYQRKGLGGQLLQAVYDDLVSDTRVLDITVEDPSDEFTALRDYIDCRNALKLSSTSSPLHSNEIEKNCQEKLKLSKRQSRRVYEILRLRVTDRRQSKDYRDFRLFVKNRLNGPYKKQQKDLEKLHTRGLDQSELVAAAPLLSGEERMRLLQDEYELLETQYAAVIEKLATD